MKKILISALAALSLCGGISAATVKVTVKAKFPVLAGDSTPVSTDKLFLIVGNEESKNTATGKQLAIEKVKDGVYEGEVDLGDFEVSDVRFVGYGTPYPGVRQPLHIANAKGETVLRVNMPVLGATKRQPRQIQKKDGVLDRFYLFAPVKLQKAKKGAYKAEVELRFSNAYMLFNVFGGQPDEVLKSIVVKRYTKEEGEAEGVRKLGNHITSHPMWAESGKLFNYNNGRSFDGVFLREECVPAERKAENGIKVYFCTYANQTPVFTLLKSIVVETDKAVYTTTFEQEKYVRSAGEVSIYDLDLSLASRVEKTAE